MVVRLMCDNPMSSHGTEVRLISDRLVLREFLPSDEEAVQAYASDPVVTRFLLWGPNTVDDTRAFIAESIENSRDPRRTIFELAVVHNESQTLIGGAGLSVTGSEEGALGYVFNRDFWSRGYATEAAKALLQFGFEQLGLRRISATCDPDNVASATVLTKAGLQFEERIRNHLRVRGALRDSLLFVAFAP